GGRNLPDGKMAFTNNDHIYATGTSATELTPTDPLFGLKDLAKQIKAAGIQTVTGEVLVDDRFFAKSRGSGSGPDMLTPIMVNDNILDIVVSPAAEAGKPAKIRVVPENNFIQLDATVE